MNYSTPDQVHVSEVDEQYEMPSCSVDLSIRHDKGCPNSAMKEEQRALTPTQAPYIDALAEGNDG